MLGRSRRRWANIEPTLVQCVVIARETPGARKYDDKINQVHNKGETPNPYDSPGIDQTSA